ncbi:hypothetical protein FOA52_004628 [Chlamydomonas sp. UWO 241]|nr:hypothetical protein FOA52_004628 [Chlamydomonas sp. UWO 241]
MSAGSAIAASTRAPALALFKRVCSSWCPAAPANVPAFVGIACVLEDSTSIMVCVRFECVDEDVTRVLAGAMSVVAIDWSAVTACSPPFRPHH